MRVVATQRGFFRWLRRPGEEFDVPEHLYSKEWMRVPEPGEVPAAAVAEVVPTTSLPAAPVTTAQTFAGPFATSRPDFDSAAQPYRMPVGGGSVQ